MNVKNIIKGQWGDAKCSHLPAPGSQSRVSPNPTRCSLWLCGFPHNEQTCQHYITPSSWCMCYWMLILCDELASTEVFSCLMPSVCKMSSTLIRLESESGYEDHKLQHYYTQPITQRHTCSNTLYTYVFQHHFCSSATSLSISVSSSPLFFPSLSPFLYPFRSLASIVVSFGIALMLGLAHCMTAHMLSIGLSRHKRLVSPVVPAALSSSFWLEALFRLQKNVSNAVRHQTQIYFTLT